MIASEVKVRGSKFTWENVGIYRSPNEETRVMEVWQPKCVYRKFYKA
jgi:hypothetical protein